MVSLAEPALILDMWSHNVDPMVDNFPFANNDIWMVAAFLSCIYFLRSFLDQRVCIRLKLTFAKNHSTTNSFLNRAREGNSQES